MSAVRNGVGWVARAAVRYRYPLLMVWTLPWFFLAQKYRTGGLNDWLDFEFGARTLIHYNSHYNTGALHLYANYPFIQIGPPPLVLVAAVQWLPHDTSSEWLAWFMALAGVWAVRCGESTARALLPAARAGQIKVTALCGGFLAVGMWAYQAEEWRHLDDVMAICFILAATSLVARQRWWWLAGILVGLGVASKPWAIVAAPVLLGLVRTERPKAALAALGAAAVCWAPFVLGAPGTLHALGGFLLAVNPHSTLHLLGVHSAVAPKWVRPLQMVVGFVLMVVLARRSHWVAVPFAGFAFRVVTDPQVWLYYGLGPLMAAVLWDALHERRWPLWTMATLAIEYGVPTFFPSLSSSARLVWAVAVLVSCARYGRSLPAPADAAPTPALVPELQPAG